MEYHRRGNHLQLVHGSGYVVTFGLCDNCNQEDYLGPATCADQNVARNTYCRICQRAGGAERGARRVTKFWQTVGFDLSSQT